MHEKTMPLVLPATTEGSLADIPARNAAEHPGAVAFSVRSGRGWTDVTAATFAADVAALAKGLIAAGIAPGEAVGIMSRTRYEWTVADFALWSAGAVPVPIYETSSPDQVQWILADSGAVGVVVETAAHLAAVEQGRGALEGLRHVWVIEQGDIDSLSQDGNDVDDAELEARRADLDRESLATVIYTSGTTGRPKGVELTHGNFLTLAENTAEEIAEVVKATGSSTLLFLPLAHVFARFIEVLAVTARVRMGHSSDLKTLLDDFASFQPTFILAVPRVFEKVYNSAEAKAEAGGKGKIFAGAAAAAVAWSEAQDAGSVPLGLRLRHAVFDKLVYAKLREAMGGKVQYAVSGGAPLGHPARPLLPGHRHHDPRGLRTHRDDRTRHGQPPVEHPDRHGGPAVARHRRAHRRRRRDPPARCQRLPRVPRQRHRHGGVGARQLVPHRVTSASSTTRASCGSPAARRRSS